MKPILFFLLYFFCVVVAKAADTFVTFAPTNGAQLKLTGQSDTILYDPADWKGVEIAVKNLRQDLRAVTGSECAPIVVGTVGKSRCVKKYKKIAQQLEGKWEQYVITTDGKQLVIIGSDKRGTIYGIYELSRQIGVSPWYWWADAPIAKHEHIYINKGEYTDGEPAVKYRGIFINDEWPSFGGWATAHFGGVNSKMYAHMFELILRLKGNYLWPAMWDSRFNEDDPESPRLADEMGIVMGTSHHEPMMRAHKEYTRRRDEVGAWDYASNPEGIEQFFREGMERNKDYDNLVTIGMRGDGDVAMGTGNDADNMKTLEKVIECQRRIISDLYGRPDAVPQLWAIFTEVQRYYDAGFRVPDDVTLLLCDNNWGYIRRIGRDFERKRKGGLGLYYHIDMNGGPWNDRWVNTTTIPKLREQLNLAYQTGIDRIWLINVGDLKPKEVPIDFIMHYAWNPKAVQPGDEKAWLEAWTRSVFSGLPVETTTDMADIIAKYTKYNLIRKPEVQVPGIFNREEMERMSLLWSEVATKAEKLKGQLPAEMQDAYYQLVYYPAMASANVAEIYNAATLGDSLKVEQLMQKDAQLTAYYNTELSRGKWSGMMQDKHIGYTQWSMPNDHVNPTTLGFPTDHALQQQTSTAEYAIPAHRYTRKTDSANASWLFLPDLGRGEGCMGSSNVLAQSDTTGKGAVLEYEVNLTAEGKIAFGILPTQDIYPERGLRIGVQLDDQPMQLVDARHGLHDEFGEYTAKNLAQSKVLRPLPPYTKLSLSGWWNGRKLPRRDEVFDNIRWIPVTFATTAGRHTLRVIMVDPEIVLQQIVVNPDNNHYSYFGNTAW